MTILVEKIKRNPNPLGTWAQKRFFFLLISFLSSPIYAKFDSVCSILWMKIYDFQVSAIGELESMPDGFRFHPDYEYRQRLGEGVSGVHVFRAVDRATGDTKILKHFGPTDQDQMINDVRASKLLDRFHGYLNSAFGFDLSALPGVSQFKRVHGESRIMEVTDVEGISVGKLDMQLKITQEGGVETTLHNKVKAYVDTFAKRFPAFAQAQGYEIVSSWRGAPYTAFFTLKDADGNLVKTGIRLDNLVVDVLGDLHIVDPH